MKFLRAAFFCYFSFLKPASMNSAVFLAYASRQRVVYSPDFKPHSELQQAEGDSMLTDRFESYKLRITKLMPQTGTKNLIRVGLIFVLICLNAAFIL